MIKNVFIDTNIAVALIFYINSLNNKSLDVFNTYSEFFWSDFVKSEFERRYNVKQKNLKSFFNDLQKYLQNPEQDLYSTSDLSSFAKNNYSGKKRMDAINSIDAFWDRYVGVESQVPFSNIKKHTSQCITDLSIDLNKNKEILERIMQLTPQRTNKYLKLDLMLKKEGVKGPDRCVTLDGHDFACKCNVPVDFVTFDEDCCNGARNIELLCFNSVKGKYDFKAS